MESVSKKSGGYGDNVFLGLERMYGDGKCGTVQRGSLESEQLCHYWRIQ
jgi:hypothetical protein